MNCDPALNLTIFNFKDIYQIIIVHPSLATKFQGQGQLKSYYGFFFRFFK